MTQFMESNDRSQMAVSRILSLLIEGCCKGFRDIDGCTQLFLDEKFVVGAYL